MATESIDPPANEAVLAVSGPLDERSAPDVVRRAGELITGTDVGRLVVDAAGMEFMDSSGIGALVTIHSLAISAGATMVLRGASAQAVSLLERVGLGPVLHIEQ